MKGLVTKELAEKLILNKFGKEFHLTVVGSVAKKGKSYNDMDILISYMQNDEPAQFCEALELDGWGPVNADKIGNNAVYKRFFKEIGSYTVTLDLYKAQYFPNGVAV